MEFEIKEIRFIFCDENKERRIQFVMQSGNVINATSCYDRYEQYGSAYIEELQLTSPIAEKFNGWLHGKDFDIK